MSESRVLILFLVLVELAIPRSEAGWCPDAGSGVSTGDSPFVLQVCDMNNDGLADLITANADSDSVSVVLGLDTSTFAPPVVFATGDEPVDLICCDVNADGFPDIVTVNHTSDDARVHLNDGLARFESPGTSYPVGEAPWGIRCLHLDSDDRVDLVTANYTGDSVSVLRNRGKGLFHPRVDYSTENGTFAVAAADVDGDEDVVTSNLLSGDVTVFRNLRDGTLTKIDSYPLGDRVFPWGLDGCDLNSDHAADLVVAASDRVVVLFNEGGGAYGQPVYYSSAGNPYKLDCADIDMDGHPDVVVADLGLDGLQVFLNSGQGSLEPSVFLSLNANPGSVVGEDLDSDGDRDLAACSTVGAVVFENFCGVVCGNGIVETGEECDNGGTFDDSACAEDCRVPRRADYDGDGDVDMADFSALQECFGIAPLPLRCFALDSDGDGGLDLTDFGTFETGLLGPLFP